MLERIIQQVGAELHKRSIPCLQNLSGPCRGVMLEYWDNWQMSSAKIRRNGQFFSGETALTHFSMSPTTWSSLFPLWGTPAFRQNPAWQPAEILVYVNGLLSESKFDSSVSSHFLPGVTPFTCFCSGNLPLFGSSYVKPYNLPSRNWDFCCLFAFLGKDVVLESAQQILIDRQSIFGNDLVSLPEISSLYVPSENMASYLSSTGVPGDIPLNLSSSTDNNQWFIFQETSSPSHPSKHP